MVDKPQFHSCAEGTSATPSDQSSWTKGIDTGFSRNMRRKSGGDQGIGRAGEGERVTREDKTVGVAQYVIASPWAH
jgi:hypothetical protein